VYYLFCATEIIIRKIHELGYVQDRINLWGYTYVYTNEYFS